MTMTRPRTLLIKETDELKEVKQFLNSKGRNSEKTRNIYGIALYHFQTFLSISDYKQYNIETVLIPLQNKDIDVYSLLDNFVNYLTLRQDTYNSNTKLSDGTIRLYIAGVRSYLEYHDIEISSKRFRNKVTIPKKHRRRKQALTSELIRTILLSCGNVRLKVFILVLASSGMRANEALSLRNSDIDFSVSPTKVHIIAENTKTKQDRDIYISDEASKELKKFIDSKSKNPNDLVFSLKGSTDPAIIYRTLHNYFTNLLKKVELDKRRRGEGMQRREISFHTLRDYTKSRIAIHTNTDFSEWVLGHSGSTYWNVSDEETRELYLKCMKYLTFLDYDTVESVGQDFEAQLQERDKQISILQEEVGKLKSDLDEKFDENINSILESVLKNVNKKLKKEGKLKDSELKLSKASVRVIDQ
jgi:integrase